jgi:signal transduction histidine kinase
MWASVLSGREWHGEFVNRKKSGELYVEDARIAPVLDATGAVAHFVAVKVDVTAEKEAERQLTNLNTELERRVAERTGELERASRTKDEFLAAMSHELRTPLNGVLGISEALQEGIYGPLTDRQQLALGRVEESGRHLLAVLSDILDVSMLAAGALTVTLDPLDVSEVCAASVRLVEESARRKHQRLTIVIDEGSAQARADARRLTQMLVNLLDNAVKFTAEGGAISVRVTASVSTVRVAVRDSGIGIAAEKIPQLFQRFVQLDATLARRHGGSGLGLALTQRLAELHGGRVEVESTPGAGSCFTLVLPRL